jgi:hypothetical protein
MRTFMTAAVGLCSLSCTLMFATGASAADRTYPAEFKHHSTASTGGETATKSFAGEQGDGTFKFGAVTITCAREKGKGAVHGEGQTASIEESVAFAGCRDTVGDPFKSVEATTITLQPSGKTNFGAPPGEGFPAPVFGLFSRRLKCEYSVSPATGLSAFHNEQTPTAKFKSHPSGTYEKLESSSQFSFKYEESGICGNGLVEHEGSYSGTRWLEAPTEDLHYVPERFEREIGPVEYGEVEVCQEGTYGECR